MTQGKAQGLRATHFRFSTVHSLKVVHPDLVTTSVLISAEPSTLKTVSCEECRADAMQGKQTFFGFRNG